MRIIAGKAKSIPIKAPKGSNTRPTSDKVREAIFSTLGVKVKDAKVLDLYAGSGALGIEALSRGAVSAEFVDSSKKAIDAISKNLERTALLGYATTRKAKVETYLRKKEDNCFDLIFIDAPYKIGLTKLVEQIKLAFEKAKPNGIIVIEHLFKNNIGHFFVDSKTKKYGQTGVTYLEKS